MNSKKWFIAVIITVSVLFLVAAVLAAVVIVRTANDLEDMWSDASYEERDEDENEADEDENKEKPTEQAPEEVPKTEGPAVAVEENGRLGLVIMHDPIFADRVAEQFAEHCRNLGYGADVWVVTSDEPAEVFDISMELIASGVDALAVSCWDTGCLTEINAVAREAGVLFVNLETPFTEENTMLECLTVCAYSRPLNQSPFIFGFMEQDLGGSGSFGVVKCGDDDALYDALVMTYPGMEGMDNLQWAADAYTDGSEESNREALYSLLEDDDLDVIICTDPAVSQLAVLLAAELGKDTLIYGYGPPSMMLGCSYDGLMFYHDSVGLSACLVYAMDAVLNGLPMEDGSQVTVASGETYYMWQNGDGYRIAVPGIAYSDRRIEELAELYG